MICMMALVAVVSIGGTIAWLTDTTDAVVNTFTESDVEIKLTETDLTDNTHKEGVENSYQMVPGNTIVKDPMVTVLADSEECYVFVRVVKENNFDNFMEYTMADGWSLLAGTTDVYYRTVADTEVDQEIDVIKDDQVTVKTTVTKEMMDALTGNTYPKLTVTAYAIQTANIAAADGKTVEQVAWETVYGTGN